MTRNRGIGRRKDRLGLDSQGYVLLWAIFAFVVMAALAGAALRAAGSERRSAGAALRSIKAFYAAEAGLRRTLPQATDSLIGSLNPGDSLDLGWAPLPGGASYRAVLFRIDDGTDPLYMLHSTGRSAGLFGGLSTQSQVFSSLALGPAGVISNKELVITGDPIIGGTCGIHSNGWMDVSGTLYHSGPVTSTGMINVTGTLVQVAVGANGNLTKVEPTFGTGTSLSPSYPDADGGSMIEPYAEPVEIPDYQIQEFCGEADYWVRNGYVVPAGGSDSTLMPTQPPETGWSYEPGSNTHTYGGQTIPPGTYCSPSNLKLSGSFGDEANPVRVSVLAEGSIDISGGEPYLVPDHSAGILILSEGDVELVAHTQGSTGVNYGGTVYAGSQCSSRGFPAMRGHLYCRGNPDPPGAKNLSDQTMLDGSLRVLGDCTGAPVASVPVPIGNRSWDMVY